MAWTFAASGLMIGGQKLQQLWRGPERARSIASAR